MSTTAKQPKAVVKMKNNPVAQGPLAQVFLRKDKEYVGNGFIGDVTRYGSVETDRMSGQKVLRLQFAQGKKNESGIAVTAQIPLEVLRQWVRYVDLLEKVRAEMGPKNPIEAGDNDNQF